MTDLKTVAMRFYTEVFNEGDLSVMDVGIVVEPGLQRAALGAGFQGHVAARCGRGRRGAEAGGGVHEAVVRQERPVFIGRRDAVGMAVSTVYLHPN